VKGNTKRRLTVFGALAFLGSVAGGAYYYFFLRSNKPKVELYFDDGSMLALPADTVEAQPFMAVAAEMLQANPLSR
jgi:hypothetical protein